MREKKPFPLWTLVIILACIALWLYAAKLLLDQQRQYMAFRESSAVLSQTRDTYLPGIAVDGIDLGGMTREEFAMAREQMRAGYIMGLESTSARMQSIGRRLLLLDRPRTEAETLERIEAIDFERTNDLMRQILTAPHSVALVGRGVEALGAALV